MAGKIQRELALLLTGKDVSASRSVKRVNSELKKLNAIGAKAGTNVSRNIQRGAIAGAVVATTAVGAAIKEAMDFESSSASVRKTVDGNVDAILDANRLLARTTGLEVNALNEIAATAGALGIAKDDIDDFTKTVAILGVTTDDVTTDLGAEAIGHLKTTLGLAGQDFEHFGNTLVHLGNNGASTEGQILSMTENIAGAADVMDASTSQVLGWAAALANTGEEAEAGGSSIQRFWLGSFKAVNAGGAKLKLMAKIAGQTGAEFKKSFGKDATGTLAKFLASLGKLSKAEQLATLEALGFKDIRITRALLKLLANTDNLTDSLDDSEKGWKDNKAATDEAAKRFATTAQKLEILKANVRDAAITIGSELLPVLADLSTDAVGWISEHQGDIRQFSKDLAAGIREAVTWAKQLDWDAIGGGFKIAAGAAGLLVEAFASAPPWLQGFLTTGFLANKFTGGAVMDVAGLLLGHVVRGVLGMTAGVVNINAGVVNGGGGLPGGATGGAAGGITAAAVAGLAASAAVLVGGLIAANETVVQPMLQGAAGSNIAGTNAIIARGDAQELRRSIDGLRDMPNQLSPLERALYDLNANGVKTHTESLIGAMEGALTRVEQSRGHEGSGLRPRDAAKPVVTEIGNLRANMEASTGKVAERVAETRRETTRGLALVQSATRSGTTSVIAGGHSDAALIAAAVRNMRPPSVFVTNSVSISAATIKARQTYSHRAGKANGSYGGGNYDPRR